MEMIYQNPIYLTLKNLGKRSEKTIVLEPKQDKGKGPAACAKKQKNAKIFVKTGVRKRLVKGPTRGQVTSQKLRGVVCLEAQPLLLEGLGQ